jgi:alpha-amylase
MRRFFVVAICLGLLVFAAPVSLVAQDAAALPWWNDRVFYEIFVRSFQDSNGDGIGDLQGLISKLDYLNDSDPNTHNDLGITGIWLMPIFKSPSYHGYDVTDYLTVNPDYGTNDDFKQLMTEAHKRGIAVIIDMVINHTSAEHPWFVDAQKPGSVHDDWYRWSMTEPKQIGPWGQQVWYKNGDRYFYAVFGDHMPDLNFKNPAVNDAVDEVAKFWLQDMGTDGFRLDAARYFVEGDKKLASAPENLTWLQQYKEYVKSVSPNAVTVGEVNTSDFEIFPYIPKSLDLAFEFDLAGAIVRSVQSGRPNDVTSIQRQTLKLYPPGQYATFLTNHDQNRLMIQLGGSTDKNRVAASVLLTSPGVPFIYYGEEIGMTGSGADQCKRTPMQWDATPRTESFMDGKDCKTNEADFNVAAETDDANSLLSTYRSLIQLRNDHVALREGSLSAVKSASHSVYSFVRQTAEESLLVIINLSDQPVSDYGLTLAEGLPGGVSSASVVFGTGEVKAPTLNDKGGFKDYTPLTELAPFSTTVIELK